MSLATIRSLSRRYVAALSAVALLALTGQSIIQLALSAQAQQGREINLAGRQRMLSQQIVKDVLAAKLATDAERRDAHEAAASEALGTWRDVHRGLQVGDEALGLPGLSSDAIGALFADMEPIARRFEASAERALDRLGEGASAERLLDAQSAYLPLMDAIVFQYDAEARAAVLRVRLLEAVIFLLTLVVLFIEGRYVFRPIVDRTRRAFEHLTAANADLATATQAAEAAERTKASILSNMSHEVRTPLQSVMGYAELLRAEAGPAFDDVVAPIERGAKRLLATLDSIIEVARLSGGEADISSETLDVGEVAMGVSALFGPEAEAKGLALTLDVDEPVGALGDVDALNRALAAVVGNAIKFTEVGSVSISVGTEGDRASIRVADTGIGMDAGSLARLGAAFEQRSEGHARTHEGIGLGLTLAICLVEAMGGEVRVTSEAGTEVQFLLPGAPIDLSPGEIRPERRDRRLTLVPADR